MGLNGISVTHHFICWHSAYGLWATVSSDNFCSKTTDVYVNISSFGYTGYFRYKRTKNLRDSIIYNIHSQTTVTMFCHKPQLTKIYMCIIMQYVYLEFHWVQATDLYPIIYGLFTKPYYSVKTLILLLGYVAIRVIIYHQ